MKGTDMDSTTTPHREMIPKTLLRLMLGLALATVAIVAYAVGTDRPLEGQPAASTEVASRTISLIGRDAKAVTVLAEDGSVLADLDHGGFVTVIQNGLATQRKRDGVDPTRPVRLVEYANGRFAIVDPDTGFSVELYAFGSDNEAAFRALLTK
jgi:putative photosynthetic complex assembly protein